MHPVTLADMLFKRPKNETTIDICPGITVGSLCASSTPRSPKRAASKASSSSSPRFSRLAYQLTHLLQGHVSALWAKDNSFAYCEIVDDGKVSSYVYERDTHTMYIGDEKNLTLPLLMWSLHDEGPAHDYTRQAAEHLALSVDAATLTVGATNLGFLCDCFYYDWKDELGSYGGSINVNTEDFNTKMESVKQAVRTGNVETCDNPLAKGWNALSFREVTYPLTSKAEPSPRAESDMGDFFGKAKSGKFVLAYDWGENESARIRPLSVLEEFVPNESYRKMANVINLRLNRVIDRLNMGKTGLDAIKDDYINIIIGGRPGTGKTTSIDALSATLGLPIYTAKVTKNTEEDTFEGMTKANSEGKFVLHDTAFLKAFENGGIIALEEFNLADPGVLQGAIGQAVERPFVLNKDGWDEVRRHPLCVIVATMNTGTSGAREPNQALTSRFPITLTMDDPSESEFLQILQMHGYEQAKCKKVYKAYKSVLNYLQNTAMDETAVLSVTMRHCLAALQLEADGIVPNLRTAIHDTMIGAIAIHDQELAAQTYDVAVVPISGLT